MRMFTDHNAKNTFAIDKSNGYSVVVTTNVTKNTPWTNILTNHGIKYAKNGSPGTQEINGKTHHWVPEKFYDKGPGGDYSDEEYKNVFVNIKYHGHITDYEAYIKDLDRYVNKYNNDKYLRYLVSEYIILSNKRWDDPFNVFCWFKPSTWFTCEPNELNKRFKFIEYELINIFNNL